MFNWIVEYLELFNFVDLREIEMLEREIFNHLTVCKQMADV